MQQAKNPILIAFVSNGMPYRLDDCSGEDDSKRKRIEFTSIQRVALATSVILAATGLEPSSATQFEELSNGGN